MARPKPARSKSSTSTRARKPKPPERASRTSAPAAAAAPVDSELVARFDAALVSLASGMGTALDPLSQVRITSANLRDLHEDEVTALMTEWGPAKFIEEVVDDAIRKGAQLSVEGDEDAAKLITDRIEDLGLFDVLREACIAERSTGGSALLAITSGEIAGRPFRRDADGRITEPLEIRRLVAKSKYELAPPAIADLDMDSKSPGVGLPLAWRLNNVELTAEERAPIHRERMHIWWGWHPGRRLRRYDFGWSLLVRFSDPWKQYSRAFNGIMALAERLVLMRYGLKNFGQLVAAGRKEEIRAIMQEIALVMSVFKIMPFDSTNDKVEESALSLSGVDVPVNLARDNVAAAAGVSVGEFFGIARSGLSDTDESASQRKDAKIAAYQKKAVLPALNWVTELVIAELGLGDVETWQWSFPPQRQETAKEKAERRLAEATASATLIGQRVIDPNEVRSGIRAEGDHPYQLVEDDDRESTALGELEFEMEQAQDRIAQLEAQIRAAGAEPPASTEGGSPPEQAEPPERSQKEEPAEEEDEEEEEGNG